VVLTPGSVAFDERGHDVYGTSRSKRSGNCERKLAFAFHDCSQKRAPRQCDAQLVHTTAQVLQCGSRIGDHEERVWQTTLAHRSRCTPRSLLEPARVGINTDDQGRRPGPRQPHHSGTVACTQVDDRLLVAANQLVELADVELGQLASGADSHGRTS
jgi:hypothetical protein